MRTLLIHQAFAPPVEPGGTRHYELARYCVSQGHQFTVVASDVTYASGKRMFDRPRLITEQKLEGIRILRAYTYAALHRSFVWRVVSFLSFMMTSFWAGLWAGPVDIVMGTSPQIFQAVSAWLIALLRWRPFLLEIRDLWPEFAIDIGVLKNPILIVLARWIEQFLYARATHLIVNSPAYRDYLLDKGVSASKIALIPNGVDPNMFPEGTSGERIRRKWDLEGQFVATYTGAFGMANDLATVLCAAQRLRDQPDIRFVLVGDGKERANLEATVRELQLKNVTFVGLWPKLDMPEILAASDICIATLKNIKMFRTTYPNKVFDYMAAGRPTVLGIDGVIREVIEAANGGLFVPPGDDAALAAAVKTLYEDRSATAAMGKSARVYVCEYFNRSRQAQDFLRLLERLVRRP